MIEFKKAIRSALKSIAISTSSGRPSSSAVVTVMKTPPLYPCPHSLGAYFTVVQLRSKTLFHDSKDPKNSNKTTDDPSRKRRNKDHSLDTADEEFPGVYKAHLLSLDGRDLALVQSTAFEYLLRTLTTDTAIPHSPGVESKEHCTEESIKSALRGEISFEEAVTGVRKALIMSPRTSITSIVNYGIFGMPLRNLDNKVTNPDCKLPRVIVYLMQLIYERGRHSPNLFRVEGDTAVVQTLIEATHNGYEMDDSIWIDSSVGINELATLFKRYIRSIPGMLITRPITEALYTIRYPEDVNERQRLVNSILLCLPSENILALSAVTLFLSLLSEHSNTTKMTASNLSIVFAPTIFDIKSDFQELAFVTKILEEVISSSEPLESPFGLKAEWQMECLQWYAVNNKSSFALVK